MAIDPEVADAINLMWVFVAGIFCFLLQAGGFCRVLARKFVAAAPWEELSQSIIDLCRAFKRYFEG